MMKCIIVDDEPIARRGIELLIQEMGSLECVGIFPNAMKAQEYIDVNEVNLMFLDIEMPGLNGLEFLRSLKSSPMVILTTAYPQFALEAFELEVIDYLVKPISLARFVKGVNRAKEIFNLSQLPEAHVNQIDDQFIFIKSDRKIVKLYFGDIRYIKGLKDYVIIYTDTEKYITAMNIKTIHRQLPQTIFARVNKSHLINVDLLTSVELDAIYLGKDEFTLGNTYKEHFLKTYVKGKLLKR